MKLIIFNLRFLLPAAFVILATSASGQGVGSLNPGSVQGAIVTTLVSQYTYPTSLSANGLHVAGTPFGGGVSYYWSAGTGLVNVSGDLGGIADDGKGAGSWPDPGLLYNGNPVNAAGTWMPATNQWTFLGMNPGVPSLFATDYSAGWDISSDGLTVVGMQWYPGYDYSAFQWTQAGGYTNIGAGVGNGSRASGISANGLVTFGWAELPSASRTPVIWYNGLVYYVNNTQYGEAFGASTSGNYVTGALGSQGFLWTPSNTVTFSNTLTTGGLTPTTVLNDGTVMGYTNGVPPAPQMRRAFVRETSGNMITFNDYAESRGMTDAQQWTFYSINDVSADGNKFIGAGINPSGQATTFLIEFFQEYPVFTASPSSLEFGTIPSGTQSAFKDLGFTNTGTGNLLVSNVALGGLDASQFLLQDGNTYPLFIAAGDTAWVAVAFKPGSPGSKAAMVNVGTNAGNQQVPVHGTGGYFTGIGESGTTALTVTPNPAKDIITVTGLSGEEKVNVHDMTGRIVLEPGSKGPGPLKFDVSRLTAGIYLLRIETPDGGTRTIRLVVQGR